MSDVEPDTKDWTWTLERVCPECGFEAGAVAPADLSARLQSATDPWPSVATRTGAAHRARPDWWSDLEYACHVRDVCRIFTERLHLMLEADDPEFANWDQDATAIADRYAEQDPSVVAGEITAAAADLVAAYAAVDPGQWQRTGRRSNGSGFTVVTLGQYAAHDLVHHGWDVGAQS